MRLNMHVQWCSFCSCRDCLGPIFVAHSLASRVPPFPTYLHDFCLRATYTAYHASHCICLYITQRSPVGLTRLGSDADSDDVGPSTSRVATTKTYTSRILDNFGDGSDDPEATVRKGEYGLWIFQSASGSLTSGYSTRMKI